MAASDFCTRRAGDDGKDGDQSEEEGEDSGEASDLQLAWEHLEAAKVIWAKDGARNAERLAGGGGMDGWSGAWSHHLGPCTAP